jgi:leucyl aminopeptidase
MRFSYKIFILLFVFASFTFLFFNSYLGSKAESPPLWLTIDANELAKVKNETYKSGVQLDLDVKTVKNGIAVVKADDEKMSLLSSHMHEIFDKCSGFIAHKSETEALESIEKTFSVNLNESFVDYTINNQTNTSTLLAGAKEINIRNTIINLSLFPNRRFNQPSGLESAAWIKDNWTQIAQTHPEVSIEYFNHAPSVSPQPSVILTIPGTTFPSEIIVLGAHQDSINRNNQTDPAPGADDDASGVASLTEVIRVLMETNFRPERTVKFIAYAAEEVGLRGSNEIAADFQSRNVNVIGVLQLDMTNFNGTPNVDFALVNDFTNAPQNQFITDLAGVYLQNLNVSTTLCNYACSDHASWTNRNYPASFPFEAVFGNHNTAIHTSNDQLNLSNNNADHALKFTKLALTYVGELAKGGFPSAGSNRARVDFDGDGKTDVSVFRLDSGVWYMNQTTKGFLALNWGVGTDKLVPADYDGDGTTDISVFRANNDPNQPDFYILYTGDFTFSGASWGISGDIPTVADYDGDKKADIAIYRPTSNTWFILKSLDSSIFTQTFGQTNDKPIVGDFDGDGKADLCVLRNDVNWYILKSGLNYSVPEMRNFGLPGDIPVPADYNGDGIEDIAMFRPSNGTWYYLRPDSNISFAQFGANGDIPVTGDYDGDGISDYAVWRPSNGGWYIFRSSNATTQIELFGSSNDFPIPFAVQP